MSHILQAYASLAQTGLTSRMVVTAAYTFFLAALCNHYRWDKMANAAHVVGTLCLLFPVTVLAASLYTLFDARLFFATLVMLVVPAMCQVHAPFMARTYDRRY